MTNPAHTFLGLHAGPRPLLQPNAWDAGSARVLAALGFEAIATTSSGFAATLGRRDGSVTREEALAHATAMAGAVEIPVAADTENGFADAPADVAAFVEAATRTGIAGCSIEDWSGTAIYDLGLATERIAAASQAAGDRIVLTARAEDLIHGSDDLAGTIARLQAYQEAGAHVLFAPGVRTLADIRSVVSSVDRPVNVLALAGCPPVDELAEAGVARISVGGAFTWAALGRLVDVATELRERGTYSWWDSVAAARPVIGNALA